MYTVHDNFAHIIFPKLLLFKLRTAPTLYPCLRVNENIKQRRKNRAGSRARVCTPAFCTKPQFILLFFFPCGLTSFSRRVPKSLNKNTEVLQDHISTQFLPYFVYMHVRKHNLRMDRN